jgi:Cdc6-like AAA superfamily ATPase
MVDIAYVMSLTTVVDHQMKEMWATKKSSEFHRNLRAEAKENADVLARLKVMYDCFFAFGMIWSFGASLDDSKRDFNGYLRGACRANPFPEGGMVYDYYYDAIENKWVHWMDRVKPFDPLFEGLFSALIISTAETERQKHLLDLHKRVKKGVLYVGTPGTGKTTIVHDYFADTDARLDDSDVQHTQVNFNNYTTSESL